MTKSGSKITVASTFNKQLLIKDLQKQGRKIYGSNFRLTPKVIQAIYKLTPYFFNTSTSLDALKLDPNKGILLLGKPLSGKTTLMYLIKNLLSTKNKYVIKSCNELESIYKRYGLETVEQLFNACQKPQCLDDFGLHNNNLKTTIIQLLVEKKFQNTKGKQFHIISSLNLKEIETTYGLQFLKKLEKHLNIITI